MTSRTSQNPALENGALATQHTTHHEIVTSSPWAGWWTRDPEETD